MAIQNSLNLKSTGVVTADGAGGYSGSSVSEHGVVVGDPANAVSSIAPSSTVGIPLVSQGVSADPAYGTVVEAGGGTGQTTYAAGDILYASGANTLTKLVKGTDGQVLTLASGVPVWSTPSAGGEGWVLLSTQTASSSSTLNFTSLIDSTYDTYVFVLSNLVMNTSNIQFKLRTSTNNGSSWDSGSTDYRNTTVRIGDAGNTITGLSSSNDAYLLSGNGANTSAVGSTSGITYNGRVYLYGPSVSKYGLLNHHCTYINEGLNVLNYNGSGSRRTVADIDAVQFFPSSGNMTSGTISLYGISS